MNTKDTYSFRDLIQNSRSYRRTFCGVVLLPLAGVIFAVLALTFKDFIFDFFPDCALNTLTGFNCISCGCTRATYALMRGDIVTAIYYNPLYIVFLCFAVYAYYRLTASLFSRPYQVYSPNIRPWQGVLIVTVILGFFIFRNTPIYRTVFY